MSERPTAPLRDGLYYDALHSHRKEDISFWLRVAGECGGAILELGCGTGRISIPIARQRREVTGLDNSLSMLRRAQAKGVRVDTVRWVQADMRGFELRRTFGCIIVPFNALSLLLSREDLGACLSCVAEHLDPGGALVIDIANPKFEALMRDPDNPDPVSEYRSPCPGEDDDFYTRVWTAYDPMQQVMRLTYRHLFPEGLECEEELEYRVFFPREIVDLLGLHGFCVERAWGDYHHGPLTAESPRQLLWCRRG